MKKIITSYKDTRGYDMVPRHIYVYSIEYIEMCHAYWAQKGFINAARLWSNYAFRLRVGLQFANDLSTWAAFERIRERQDLLEESEFQAPRLVVNLSNEG